jgi:hypothetical protein
MGPRRLRNNATSEIISLTAMYQTGQSGVMDERENAGATRRRDVANLSDEGWLPISTTPPLAIEGTVA